MAQARKALGGEQKLAAPQRAVAARLVSPRDVGAAGGGGGGSVFISMSGPGRAGAAGQAAQMTGDIEIDVEFPDKYIKVDVGTGHDGDDANGGLRRRPAIRRHVVQPARHARHRRPARRRCRRRARWRCGGRAKISRACSSASSPAPSRSFAVTYTYAGQAESPDGKADVIDVKGADNFAARLFLDTQSHLPLMLTYIAPEPRVVMTDGA